MTSASRGAVLGHGGPVGPDHLWDAWRFEPVVVLGLVGAVWLYGRGVRRLWAVERGAGVAPWRCALFGAGAAAVGLALLSPVDAAADALFSAHMVQHVLLVVVAAPLLVLGAPLLPVSRALPPRSRRLVGALERRLSGSVEMRPQVVAVWWVAYVGAFWIWHVPSVYDAAQRGWLLHDVQHATFLVTGVGFWWTIAGVRRYRSVGVSVLALLGALLQGAWAGTAFVATGSTPYRSYLGTTHLWNLTPAQDFQAGGLVIWAAGPVYALAACLLLFHWLQRDRSAPRSGAGVRR